MGRVIEATVPMKKRTTKTRRRAAKQERGEIVLQPDLSHYRRVENHAGRRSWDCGDKVARMLAGKTLPEVYKIAAGVLGVPASDLEKRYAALNAGMARMNCSNRMRGHLARAKK